MTELQTQSSVNIMAALSVPTRWYIMEVVTEYGKEMTTTEIVTALDGKIPFLGNNTLRPHLKKLVEAGLITSRIEAGQYYYLCRDPHFFAYLVALCDPMTKKDLP